MKRNLLLIADTPGGGGSAAPAAPATPPAAAPAKPATPAKPAAPPKETPAEPSEPEGGGGDDVFDAMDKRITARRGGGETAPETPSDETPPKEKPETPPKEKPETPHKETPEPALDEAQIDKMAPKPLRDAVKRGLATIKAKDAQLADLQSKLKAAETHSKESPVLTERIKTLEKQLEERISEISALKQEASPEFKDKYDKPFDQAAAYAKSRVEGLLVNEVDPETDTVTGKRPATWDDFVAIYRMPTAAAIDKAEKVFGSSAQFVLNQMDKLQQLQFLRDQAFEEEKAGWKKRTEEQTANTAKQREEMAQHWTTINKAIADKNPEWFAEQPDDTEGNELLKLAFGTIDQAFSRITEMTPQQRVTFHAQLRNRAAAFPRLVQRLDKANARIKELETQIAEHDDSDPNKPGRRASGETPPGEKNWKTELREAMSAG